MTLVFAHADNGSTAWPLAPRLRLYLLFAVWFAPPDVFKQDDYDLRVRARFDSANTSTRPSEPLDRVKKKNLTVSNFSQTCTHRPRPQPGIRPIGEEPVRASKGLLLSIYPAEIHSDLLLSGRERRRRQGRGPVSTRDSAGESLTWIQQTARPGWSVNHLVLFNRAYELYSDQWEAVTGLSRCWCWSAWVRTQPPITLLCFFISATFLRPVHNITSRTSESFKSAEKTGVLPDVHAFCYLADELYDLTVLTCHVFMVMIRVVESLPAALIKTSASRRTLAVVRGQNYPEV